MLIDLILDSYTPGTILLGFYRISLLAYSPLAMGILSGKYLSPDKGPTDARLNLFRGIANMFKLVISVWLCLVLISIILLFRKVLRRGVQIQSVKNYYKRSYQGMLNSLILSFYQFSFYHKRKYTAQWYIKLIGVLKFLMFIYKSENCKFSVGFYITTVYDLLFLNLFNMQSLLVNYNPVWSCVLLSKLD